MLAGGRCAPVQVGHATRISARQLCAQELAHGLQVPVLPPRAVDRHEERASAHELAEHRTGVTPPEQGVAQRRTEPLEHRGLEQERPERLVPLRVEQLEAEIVGDVPRRTGEAGERLGRLRRGPRREGREIDAGGPSLGASGDGSHIHVRRGGAQNGPQHGRCLVAVEAEVGSPELRGRPAGPSERQCELGLAASGHHDVQRLRRKIEEPPEIRVDTGLARLLVSVQHQGQLVGEQADSRRHLLGPVAGTAAGVQAEAQPRLRLLECGRNESPERRRRRAPAIRRKPTPPGAASKRPRSREGSSFRSPWAPQRRSAAPPSAVRGGSPEPRALDHPGPQRRRPQPTRHDRIRDVLDPPWTPGDGKRAHTPTLRLPSTEPRATRTTSPG